MTAADQDLGDQHRPVHSALPPAAKDFQGQRAGVVTRCLAAAVNVGVVAVMLAAVYFSIAGVMLLFAAVMELIASKTVELRMSRSGASAETVTVSSTPPTAI